MELDMTSIIAVPAAAVIVTSIVAMGAIKIAPNFAKWAVNKVVGFIR